MLRQMRADDSESLVRTERTGVAPVSKTSFYSRFAGNWKSCGTAAMAVSGDLSCGFWTTRKLQW